MRVALNPKQLAVLKWISDGCADGVYEGTAHRLVARALHNRGLVTIKGHGASWSAQTTSGGNHYLEHGVYPEADANENGGPAKATRPAKARKHGPVDELMTSLAEAPDQRLVVPYAEAGRYRRLAGIAKNLERMPDGLRITFGHENEDDGPKLTLTLEPLPDWQTKVLDPLHVGHELPEPSDIVRTLKEKENFQVVGDPRERAFRLLDALVVGAREAGMAVAVGQQARGGYGAAYRVQNEVVFSLGQDSFQLRFTQAMLQRPHEPTEQELARARRGHLFPDFDEVPDDHLGIVLDGPGGQFWASRWKDTSDHRLEDDLPQMLEEMRLRHGSLTDLRQKQYERELQEEQARVERQQRLQIARQRAAVAHREHMIDEEARDQSRRWHEASQMRAYAAEVRRLTSTRERDAQEQAHAWADRILAVADAFDPLPDKAVAPTNVPAPSEVDLQKFMRL
ncbi:hypothetical protein ACIRG5_28340 [Lentzea sp. NPDC102401]|uniref:hypothetical protein n=1 Tax=Lentzea sp. NPDC102401 TaxID=3364128 RepID=UPI0038031CD0